MPKCPSLDEYLRKLTPESPSTSLLRQRFEALGLDPNSSLYKKAARIVRAIDGLFEEYGELSRYHAEWIQSWVLETLDKDEFKHMAQIIFERWATPERLEGPGIPHIHLANDALGEKIVEIAEANRLQQISIIDLGTGTLGTVERILNKTQKTELKTSVVAVEFTPALLKIAQARAIKLNQASTTSNVRVIDADMQKYLQEMESDSVDFITSSYAIHHLHPEDQLDLARNAHRCIRSDSAFLLADPQEGKSDFNLKVLHREEPEGVFAAFSSPESMAERLTLAGFSNIQILIRDDTNYTGFALAAIK